MKNPHYERRRRRMRDYHRYHPWRLHDGLFIPHAYPETRALSWWDDVGFILNRRRVMVWWVHPRTKYADAIEDLAWREAGDDPSLHSGLFESSERQSKPTGRSRKKVAAYRAQPSPESSEEYFKNIRTISERMQSEGIDLVVRPSMSIKTLPSCTGLELCIPIEVHSEDDVRKLAALAKQLLKRETTLADKFPDYQYDRDDWLEERPLRERDCKQAGSGNA